MRCEERFYEIYGKDPVGISFCPYRICPIGAHSDHNLGKITGLAIDKGIHIAYKPKMNGVVEMCSLQFPKRAQWHIREIGEKTGDWADYLRGATWALSNRFPLTVGLCGVIEGSLPIGGLSSSAAVILSFLEALCQVNGIKLSSSALISIAFEAEKKYVGVNVGTLDQSCEVLSKKDHLLYLDCKDNSYELIPTNPNMKPYKIAVFFSGLEHSLAGSKYNMRVDELRSGIYALQAFRVLTTESSMKLTPGMFRMRSTRPIKISCRCNGQNVVNIGIPSSSVWKLVRKHGGEAIWRSMDACPLNLAGAASTTGSPVRRSRSNSTRL